MGNLCCSGTSSPDNDTAADTRSARPLFNPSGNNFSGPGRTLASSSAAAKSVPVPAGAAASPADSALGADGSAGSQARLLPHATAPAVVDEATAQRREMMRLAAENRGATRGGKLAQDLAKQKAQGMEGARKTAAAEALRRREVEQQEEVRRGG